MTELKRNSSPHLPTYPESHLKRASSKMMYLEHLIGNPFTSGNRVTVLRNGNEIFPAMLKRIRQAKYAIYFLTYVYWTGSIAEEFADALSEQAVNGLDVRLILDSFGAYAMPERLLKQMKGAGVKICWYQPATSLRVWRMDHRTHRKVLVCDNTYAFTGGVGIAQEWEGNARNPDEWRDTHFEIQGPAAAMINGAFWHNWFERRPEKVPFLKPPPREIKEDAQIQVIRSAASGRSSDAENVLKALLHLATESLIIITPYFVPDDLFLHLLCQKASQGVTVELLLPGKYLDRRYERWAGREKFDELLDRGVKIHRYQRTMLHCKIILMDGELACIGSANMNQRSLGKDDEILLNVIEPDTVRTLGKQYEEDLTHSDQATDAEWLHRSLASRIGELLTKPFRAEL